MSLATIEPTIFDATLIEEREYWLRRLAQKRGSSAPPADGERKGAGDDARDTFSIELPEDVAQAARRLAGGSAFLLYTAFAAGVKACLYRYTAGESVAIGSPALAEAGKPNALVILDEMDARTSFKQLLLGVRETLLEAYARQQYPFSNLVRDLGLEQAKDNCPLFDVAVLLKGLHGALPEVHNDLTISFEDDSRAISVSVDFNRRLYTRERIELFVGHFVNVLRDALENKERPLGELTMMSEEERRRVLVEWSRAQSATNEADAASGAPFVAAHQLFEQCAADAPHALALAYGERRLTYGELNAAANRLARHLHQRGVGTDVRVALCLDRSPEMIVALLAVLKAGGTYLPLDPSYPLDRLSFMLEDSQAAVLVTRGELADELPSFWGQVVDLDEESEEIAAQSDENIEEEVSGGAGAYVIYTSGSTGRPKGVVVTHAGLFNLTLAESHVYRVELQDRILQFASPSFDASVFEIVMALCTGASLWLATREELMPGPGLVELLTRCAITNVTLPPSALAAMPEADLPELRTLIVAGEACPAEAVEQWGATRRFFNAYGPTEATVWATVKECMPAQEGQPTIGRPVVNTEVFILDQEWQPVPVGVAGELYLGGAGLARGYLNRPELTAERFIPHPFTTEAGARLYRTGDVARFRADGEIEFLGRTDEQVKVRGFRIELGEVESALREYAQVGECVVMARSTEGAQRLVGYIVAADGAHPTTSDLAAHLKTRLPDYMIPSVFVMLDELPLTPNGKVDRKALPAPDASRPELKESFAAPRTQTEEVLAGIWADVLGLERVGIHDNFFELGGDSILSIQIIARANQAGLQLSPKQMFQHQTVEELAAVAGTAVIAVAEQGLVTGDVSLTPIQRWFFEQELAEPHHYNQSVLLSVRQSLDAGLLREVVLGIVEHHDALRLRFVREASGWRQFNAAPDADVPFTEHDLSGFAADEQQTRLAETIDELQASLNLTKGPLLRVALFDFGTERAGRLFIAVHHLAMDGVSWRILLEDLQAAYRQASEGTEISLPAKTTSFKEWGGMLQASATGEEMRDELGYWLDEPRRAVSLLPVDYPAANRQPSLETARTVRVSLSPEETRALLQDVPAAYNSQINDVLLTALAQSLTGWAGERRLLVALEGHGREEIEGAEADLSRTVGWFTSLFPALLDLGETTHPGEAIKAIKEQLRAVPNRGIGYGVLRYLSDATTAEALAALPHAEVSFNYLGQFDQTLDEASPFEPAPESNGHGHSLLGTRPHMLEINSSVSGGRLQLSWTYSKNVHRETTIKGLAADFIAALRTLIAHCASGEAVGYTPSDFPLAGLSQQEVDGLAETYTDIEDVYPLSPLQQGLLFHTLLEEGKGVYFTQLVCEIPSALNVAAFKRAWTRVQERHAILRTAFAWAELPAQMQVVLRRADVPWDEQDWRGVSAAEQEQRLAAYLETNQRRGFDLNRAPLMRCTLIRKDADTYQFIWSLHHLLLDGWALFRVIKEVFSLYESFQQGEELQLEQPRPYRDFIAWLQRQKLSDEIFWRQALKGFTAPTPLGVDRLAQTATAAAPGVEDEHRNQRLKLSTETTAALQELVKRQGLTLNTAVQGAWALLLSRYSGEPDVVFGATASGRPATLEGVESMIGPFINMLPVRARIEAGTTLLPWLKEIQAQQVEARQYEYSPLVRVQSWSEVPRGQSLFESVLIFENFPIDESLRRSGGEGGLQVRRVNAVEKMNYPLALVVMPGRELSFRIAYHNSRFDDAAITRMLGHLRHLLEEMTARPERSLASYGLLTETELRHLTVEWNETNDSSSGAATSAPAAPFVAAHQLFEQWAASSPDATAVAFGERRLTYAELNASANRLARHLRQRGVGTDVRVALCLDRSPEMIVALLAVLKAGGTYLPLDPAYPLDRLSFMLEDSQAAVLVTRGELADELPSFWGQVVDLDEESEEIAAQSDENIEEEVSGGAGAYVIYTSGSTGRPKGVVVTHAGLFNLTRAQRQTFDPQPADRVLQFASLSFDASIFEIVMGLCTGASLWLATREELMPGPGLVELLERCRITNATLTPSALGAMPPAELPELRTLIVAGEACPAEAVEQWGATRRFFNAYGPTEATVWATVKECEPNEGQPTIGRPVVNAQAYILDRQFQPVPVGVAGELYLSGAGLARGYLNRPDLTAERFIPHAFSTEAGARLYRTGDVARFRADGEIEFLGRADEQVKVRGFRIELGEVESALREHAQVGECVVVTRATDGAQQLVGYVVVEGEGAPTTSGLRAFLQEKLPDYMIPGVFVMLAALPLTPNGKVDRKSLPSPDESRPELAEQFVAPRTSVEEALAQIWAEVLHVERVGIDDNYFALGGDSIRSVQILSKAQGRGLNLTLPQIFQHHTIRHLAQELSTVEAVAVSAPQGAEAFSLITEADRALMPEGVEDAYPLTMVQAGMLFHSEFNPDTAIYHSINTFHLRAPFRVDALREAVARVAARHPVLRTSFDLNTFSEPLQLVHTSTLVPVQEFDLRALAPDECEVTLEEWLELEKVRHFDWSCAPLLRLDMHRRTEETFQITFTAHHAIIDGWSDGLFLTELFSLYLSLLKEDEVAVEPPPAATLSQFVALEREALESNECREFWLRKMEDAQPARLPRLALPSPEGDEAATEFMRVEVPVSPETSEGLKRLAHEAGVPLKSVLLAAHLRVMGLLGGQADALTGVVWNGRPETTDGERVIGLFLNTLPFRMSLPGGTWLDLARATFHAEREVMPHRRYPLAQLQRMLGGQTLFETCFNFTHMHIYQSLQGFREVEVLNGRGVAETNFAIMANFNVSVGSSRVMLVLDCNASELGDDLIAAISRYYAKALAAMASDGHGSYELCDLLTDNERRQLLEEFNDTRRDYARHLTLAEMFEQQAARTPTRIALVAGDEQLTYAELNARAERLAGHLRRLGVGAESLVAVCAERSARLVTALLAVLKAGGAYVPLDPHYPAERLAYMLADSAARVLLTERHLEGRLPEHDATIVHLDEPRWEDNAPDEEATPNAAAPHARRTAAANLAYVIYTSGSTGRPKGVAISHASAATLLHWSHDFFSADELAGVLCSTSVCFDLSIFELFVPLTCGGRVILADDALHLPELAAAGEVTLINTVPSAMTELLRLGAVPESVRVVNLAGEALRRSLVDNIYAQAPQVGRVLNLYGPTEDTTYSTWREVARGLTREPEIGRGLANTRAYVLDASLRLVPVGVRGELYLAGEGLARGYLNRPELTAERFIPDPFAIEAGARMYRTGDVARFGADGELEYFGRADHQVKVRGFRIELGEIEVALGAQAGVRESVVVVREDAHGEQQLMGYVVAAAVEAGEPLRGIDLRVSLRGRLPEYMVPSVIVVLDELPLTPNGKVDRKALRAMKWEDEARAFDPLETPTEEMLAELWSDMLGVERIGANDNFFDLGGHSLTATRLISRVRAAFGVELSLRTLFVAPTVRGLAGAIEEAALEQSSAENMDELLSMLENLSDDEETTEISALNRVARDNG